MIPPGSWLGLLGGGQLGRMFCMAAQSMGYRVAVLDPGTNSPAGSVADRHLQADYLDAAALLELAKTCAAATTEFENVPAESLRYLAQHCRVAPLAESVAIAQNRILEKQFLAEQGFAVVPFKVLRCIEDCRAVDPALLPGIVKSSRFGYDGKGQQSVQTVNEVEAAFAEMGDCVLEQRVSLASEISVLVARNDTGQTGLWPIAENQHRNSILDLSIVPARISSQLTEQACSMALGVAEKLNYRGILCVEMFVPNDHRLLINEIAPRPHNSGHYTIDACVTSQFEQQVRILCQLPLGSSTQFMPAVMVNLLGDVWNRGEPDWNSVLQHPEAKLHLYGKSTARPGRKMGHITCLASTVDAALQTALHIKAKLGIAHG